MLLLSLSKVHHVQNCPKRRKDSQVERKVDEGRSDTIDKTSSSYEQSAHATH